MIGDPPSPLKGGFIPANRWMAKPPLRGEGGSVVCGSFYNLCITSPERSFGSNHVALGGMILPESAMSIICCIDTG